MSSIKIFPQVATVQISSYAPNKIFGLCKDMYLGRKDANDIFRILFKFPITTIPNECIILKAVLKIYVQFAGMLIPSSFTPYALKEDWNIQNITWNNQPSFYTHITGETKCIKRVDFYHFNITEIVTKWYEHEIMNYGLIIKNKELSNGTYNRVNTVINSNLSPMLEITYGQKSNITIVPTRYVSETEEMDTDELYRFSSTINASLTKTITCHIKNLGNSPIEIKFQSSPNGIDFCDDIPESTVIKPHELIWSTPYCFATYGRIAAKNVNPGETSKIRIWYEAQE
ncbi:DNRLRE domain-containing protein [Crassaminicella profunda]|uniref:DNRLRE domain-containing protein n=1 Tax=Crassaminicella profunda TaxID=1286698 RepID=UPI001CA66EE7|nr:DNRLRE domain-containing protein [Crassaminicella profunda]QZY56328.1 DNRLRE domain-containing protein [Crassaminicella profunda]